MDAAGPEGAGPAARDTAHDRDDRPAVFPAPGRGCWCAADLEANPGHRARGRPGPPPWPLPQWRHLPPRCPVTPRVQGRRRHRSPPATRRRRRSGSQRPASGNRIGLGGAGTASSPAAGHRAGRARGSRCPGTRGRHHRLANRHPLVRPSCPLAHRRQCCRTLDRRRCDLGAGGDGGLRAASPPAAPRFQVCWIVGEDGTVVVTTDGLSSTRLPFPLQVPLASVSATSADAASVTTRDGRVFTTTDRGRSVEVAAGCGVHGFKVQGSWVQGFHGSVQGFWVGRW